MNHTSPAILSTWYLAIRPKTLWAAVAPVIIGTAVAFGDGGMHLPSVFFAMIGALMIQIGTNLANDYFDFIHGADTKDRKGPARMTQTGAVLKETMRNAFIFSFAVASIAGIYLLSRGGIPVLIIGISSIAAGILYTGGPKPYGYSGLGEIFVFIFFGLVAVGGTYYVQTLTITPQAILAGFGPGFLSTAILVVNNLRDRTTDSKTGKNTLAVRFGSGFARIEYIFCLTGAMICPIVMVLTSGEYFWSLSSLLVILVLIPSIKKVLSTEDGEPLNSALASTGKALLIYSCLFSLGWVL